MVVTVLLVTEVAMQGVYQADNLATMRGSVIWFALAAAWAFDSTLALFRHNRQQSALAGFFACCFFAAALLLRKREKKRSLSR